MGLPRIPKTLFALFTVAILSVRAFGPAADPAVRSAAEGSAARVIASDAAARSATARSATANAATAKTATAKTATAKTATAKTATCPAACAGGCEARCIQFGASPVQASSPPPNRPL